MGDDIKTGLPLQGGDFAAEPLYRVKGVDADTKRNTRENFEEDLENKKEEGEGEKAPNEKPDPGKPLEEIKDDVILSSRAQRILTAAPGDKEQPPVEESAPPEPPPGKKLLPPIHHIDILA
ncbi:MAG: hypothetical protein V2A34_12715 [Lentisphaerota bacterium]